MLSNVRAPLPPEDVIDLATTEYGRVLLDAKNVYEDATSAIESSLAEELNDAVDVYNVADTDLRAHLVRPINLAAQQYADAVQYVLSSYQAQLAAAQSRLESARQELIAYAYTHWRPPPFIQDGVTWTFSLQSIRPFSSQAEAVTYSRQLQRSPQVVSTGSRVQVDYEPTTQTWAVTSWQPVQEESAQPTGRAPTPPSVLSDWGGIPIEFRPPIGQTDTTPSPDGDSTTSSSSGDTTMSLIPRPAVPVTLSCPPPVIQVVCAQHCPPVQAPITSTSGTTPSTGGLAGMVPVPSTSYSPTSPAPAPQPTPAPQPEAPSPAPPEETPSSPGPPEEGEEEEESGEEVYVAPQPALTCSLPGLESGWEIIAVYVGVDRADVSKRSEEAIRQSEKDYPDRAHRYTVVQCGQRYESIVLREIKSERCPLTEATKPTVTAMPPPHAAITSLLVPGGQYSEDVDVGCYGRVIPLGGDEWRFALTYQYYARKWLSLWNEKVNGGSSGSKE